jgi:hypothetical protein
MIYDINSGKAVNKCGKNKHKRNKETEEKGNTNRQRWRGGGQSE